MHTHYASGFAYTLHPGDSGKPPLAHSHEGPSGASAAVVVSDTRSDEQLGQLIAFGKPTDMNALMLDRRDATRTCDIVRYCPGQNEEALEAALSVFVEGAKHKLADLGLIVCVDQHRVVALHLHREASGQIVFRYYDPNADAALRDKLKESIFLVLRRCGIDREWHFTGVRHGGDNVDAEHGEITTVLALRDMLAGEPELVATPDDVLEWQERLRLTQPQSLQARQANESAMFMQKISERMESCQMLARKLAEKSEAISLVLEYFPPRRHAQFQVLNKRFYEHIVPSSVSETSLNDFPVKRTPPMIRPYVKQNEAIINAYVRNAGQNIVVASLVQALKMKVNPGPYQQFLGWLLLCESLPSPLSNEADADMWLKAVYARYREEKNDPAMAGKMRLSHALGKLLWPDTFMPGDNWIIPMGGASQGNTSTALRIARFEKRSVVNLFNDVPVLPAKNAEAIHCLLDEALNKNVITEEVSRRAHDNLMPVCIHLAQGKMVVDLFTLPIKEAGREKSIVFVNCTPVTGTMMKPRQIFAYEDILLDEEKHVRLSERLRNDIREHARKMGWPDHCLGESFDLNADPVHPRSHDNDYVKLVESLMLQYRQELLIFFDPNSTAHQKLFAQQNMREIDKQLVDVCIDTVRYIDRQAFSGLLRTLSGRVSISTFSRLPLALVKAIRKLSDREAISTEELKHVRSLLVACREKLAVGVTMRCVVKDIHASAYSTINVLNEAIQQCDDKLALRDSMRKRQSEQSVAALEAALHDVEEGSAIDVAASDEAARSDSQSNEGTASGVQQGGQLRKRDIKYQEKQMTKHGGS